MTEARYQPEICREYEKWTAASASSTKKNTGVSDSRNQAIETARGEYLQFMDSDDWLTQDATELCPCSQEIRLRPGGFRLYRVDGAVFTEKQHMREREWGPTVPVCEYDAGTG